MKALMSYRIPWVLAAATALIVSLTIVSPASANQPTGLTAEICDDLVCLSWNPAGSDVSYQQVLYWPGNNPNQQYSGGRRTVGSNTGQARISLDALDLEPAENEGDTQAYSFRVIAVKETYPGINITYSNYVTLNLPRPEPEPERESHPSSLTAEVCDDMVCLAWIPGTGDFDQVQVQAWEGFQKASSDFYLAENVGLNDSEARILLKELKIEPTYSVNSPTARYSFQVVGIPPDDSAEPELSNKVTMNLPRELIPRIDPSGLVVELCEDRICTSWTPGEGDYGYQGVKFWQKDRPDDTFHHGGVAIISVEAEKWDGPISRIRRHPGDSGEVTFTVRVEAVTRYRGAYEYVGYSNEVDIDLPVHLMAPVDANEKR